MDEIPFLLRWLRARTKIPLQLSRLIEAFVSYASVAIDVPLRTAFDYRADGLTTADLGCRVLVPFGKRRVIGVVVDVKEASELPGERVKSVQKIFRKDRLTPADVQLLRFAADYYQTPIGEAMLAALPVALRQPKASDEKPDTVHLTDAGRQVDMTALRKRAPVMALLLDALQNAPASIASLTALASSAAATLRKLMARGWIAPCDAPSPESVPTPLTVQASGAPHADIGLTPDQQKAADGIKSRLGTYHATLLHGVTGSGKTEVYLSVVASVIAQGQQALLLVPEIALTPQLLHTVQSRFPHATVTHLHSALSDGERLRQWRAAASGRASIVLGTRLAVFTPLPALGLIIVDEEHDTSFKQGEGFRYSARDLAVLRARRAGVPVVLGSATPSLETYHNARSGRYERVSLPARFGAPAPRIRCIDTRAGMPHDGLSPELLNAIEARRRAGEQSMVFINRRGYAPVLMCPRCRWLSGCHRCSAQMVLHLDARRLRCHHCGSEETVPAVCPECGNADIVPVGQGTQRIESALRARFPDACIVRIDRDSTRRKDAWMSMRTAIHEGKVDILVGTQMLAKGHDFPLLSLVGVVNSDASLYSADFRASERLFALLVQVAGRAGRREKQGEVLIQTAFPEHPLYSALCRYDLDAYAEGLLEERQQAGFPPFMHQAVLRAEAARLEVALAFLDQAARRGRELADNVEIYDPVPAPMVRLAGKERGHLLVQCRERPPLHRFLRTWLESIQNLSTSPARWSIDVDPTEI